MDFDVNFITAQALGVLVIIVGALILPHMKTKARMLLCNLVSNALQIGSFLLLGAVTGVFTTSSIMFRGFVLFLFARVDKRAPIWVLIGLMALHIFMVWFGREGWISLLMLSPLVRLYGLWQDNLQFTRVSFIITALGFGIYSLISGAWIVGLNEFILIVSTTVALWRFRQKPLDTV